MPFETSGISRLLEFCAAFWLKLPKFSEIFLGTVQRPQLGPLYVELTQGFCCYYPILRELHCPEMGKILTLSKLHSPHRCKVITPAHPLRPPPTDLKSPEDANAETALAEKPEIIQQRRAKSRSRARPHVSHLNSTTYFSINFDRCCVTGRRARL